MVNDLLGEMTQSGHYVIGYADDLAILVRSKHEGVISSLMQNVLNTTKRWCDKEECCVNPKKTIIVSFARRKKLNPKVSQLAVLSLQFSNEVKYLGATLDCKLK